MRIETLVVGPLQVNCFIVASEVTGEALVIDPGEEGGRILALLESEKLELKAIVNTHGHFDHIGANKTLVEKTGAELHIHEGDIPLMQRAEATAAVYGIATTASPEPTRTLKDGDNIVVGQMEFEVIHIPGHSLGGIALFCGGHLFCGDSLFADSVGRTDLPGGDHDTLVRAIRSRLLVLPEETVVHPGHGPDTTIGREKRSNPYVGM